MDLSLLRYFQSVAQSGSFVAGARRSFISPPAMTQAIKKLEDQVGSPLFLRARRQIVLTPAGELLLEHCETLFRQVESMQRELAALQGQVAGPLRIATYELFSAHLLPRALSRLLLRFPKVVPESYELVSLQLKLALARGQIDVALTSESLEGEGLRSERLGSTPGRLVCGRSHPLYRRGKITRTELDTYPFVVPRMFGAGYEPPLDQYPEARFPRRVVATVELMQMGISLVSEGVGLGHFPEASIREELETGRLRALSGVRLDVSFDLTLVTESRLPPKPAVRALREELTAALRQRH